jgi:hypothetical protein
MKCALLAFGAEIACNGVCVCVDKVQKFANNNSYNLDKDANPTPKKKDGDEKDELDLIGGTSEDDFTEAMAIIRERELLYGQNSLLSNFGPLVAEICANNLIYKVGPMPSKCIFFFFHPIVTLR